MNIAFPSPNSTSDQEVMQLLAILRDCGIDEIWQFPDMKLISFYLRNTAHNANDIKAEIGQENYGLLIKSATCMSKSCLNITTLRMRKWLLKHANGYLLNQALRISAQENLNTPAKTIAYDQNNEEFDHDTEDFAKLVTLLTIEQFPNQMWWDQIAEYNRLTYYQYFRRQYGNSTTLQAFRRSIVSRESGCLHQVMNSAKQKGRQLKPKTSGARKYMEMPAFDRLRLMRYYHFVTQNPLGNITA